MTSLHAALVKWTRRILLGEQGGVRRMIRGKGNVVITNDCIFNNVELDIVGDNNHITIGAGSILINVKFRIRGSEHRIEFGRNCRITRAGMIWFEDDHGLLQIGNNTTMVEVHIAVTEPGSKVRIGEDCMFANDIDIRTGDTHPIFDVQTSKQINFAEDVMIGNHVWIAPHAVILKGVHIGENSVVATGSIVTRSCESGVIIAGNPAKVVRTGISWKRERHPQGEV